MCLGLYEDTGSFTYSSTTERDFLAAAYLLSQGANLNVVSDLIARELSPEQVVLLNDMIQAVTRYFISGTEIVVTRRDLGRIYAGFCLSRSKNGKNGKPRCHLCHCTNGR